MPPQSAKPLPGSTKNNKKLFITICVVVSVLLVGAGFIEIFTTENLVSCLALGKVEMKHRMPSVIHEFNSIDYVSGQTSPQSPGVLNGGDCVDSDPTISASKDYVVAADAGSTFDHLQAALASAGYKQSSDNDVSQRPPCSGVAYNFLKNERTITVAMKCATNAAVGGDAWRQIAVSQVIIRLNDSWYS